jgi:hypothetical protein
VHGWATARLRGAHRQSCFGVIADVPNSGIDLARPSSKKLKFDENPSGVLLNITPPTLWHLRFFPVKTLMAPGIPQLLIINNGV